MATLNGAPVTTCRVQIPAYGLWWAEVECASTDALASPATLVLGGATFAGRIMTGGAYNTRTRYRIAAGNGGHGRALPRKSYANDLGVKAALVLRDAALACGEVLGPVDPTMTLGPAWSYPEGWTFGRVLDAVSPRAWYVDAAGVTQLGRRLATPYLGEASRMVNDAAQARYEIAPDASTLGALVPGVVVDGVEAVDVEHEIDDSGTLRTTLWGRGIADTARLGEAIRRLVEAVTAGTRFHALWEYRVVQTSGAYVDLQIARVSSGMPDLRHVPAYPATTYADSTVPVLPPIGSTCVVAFLNGDPSRPRLVALSGDRVIVGVSAVAGATMVAGATPVTASLALLGRIGVGA